MKNAALRVIHRLCWRRLPRSLRRRMLFLYMRKTAPRAKGISIGPNDPIYIAGFFSTASGLGQSARLSLTELRQKHPEAIGIDLSHSLLQPTDLSPAADVMVPSTSLPSGPGQVIIHVNAPFAPWANKALGSAFLERKRIIGYWAWELPDIPPDWHQGFDYVDEIWVPSQFTKNAIATHTTKTVRVVPHALPSSPPSARRFAEDGVIRIISIFNMASGFTRKNPLAAIRAFQTAFAFDERAELIVKLSHPDAYPDGVRLIEATVAGWPNIRIIETILSAEAIANLYRHADIYLSLHRSEGFGLPLLEAKSMGLHVVATGWSGNVDFMQGPRCHGVPYHLVPAEDPQGTYDYVNMQWAEPDIDAAALILRRISAERFSGHRM